MTTSENKEPQSIFVVLQKDDINQLYATIAEGVKDIDATNDDGRTPLMVAVNEKEQLKAALLLHEGASIMTEDKNKKNAFQLALEDDDATALQLMLWKKIIQQDEAGALFFELCRNGDIKAVKYCLEHHNDDPPMKCFKWCGKDAHDTHIQNLLEWRENKEKGQWT